MEENKITSNKITKESENLQEIINKYDNLLK